MNREQAMEALELMRKVVGQARDDTTLQNWGVIDARPSGEPPEGSVWASLADLHEPLVECYDALGVDRASGFLYVLTIDRDPWNASWARPEELYSEYFAAGPLGGGLSRLDSVLHLAECRYRWRPLRRVRIEGDAHRLG